MGTIADSQRTRAKLLEAAGKLFADHGFHGVSVRQIAAAAGVQINAINYHFDDKANLYRQCLATACTLMALDHGAASIRAESDPKLALRKAIRLIIDDRRQALASADQWQTRLAYRELMERTEQIDEVVDAVARPQVDLVAGLIARVTGRQPDDARVLYAVIVIIGGLTQLIEMSPMLRGVTPGLVDKCDDGEWLVEQTTVALLAYVSAEAS